MHGSIRSTRIPTAIAFSALAVLTCILYPPAAFGEAAAEANAASEMRLSESVKYLASDALEGRGVGTEGLNLAADYLAKQFSDMGLKTTWFDGTPFQKFTVAADTQLGDKQKNHLKLLGQAEGEEKSTEIELKLDEDFNPLAIGGSGKFDAPIVFVGYGITAKDWDYDDYADIDVKGKVVLMLRKEPQQGDAESIFDGKKASRHATFQQKISNAAGHGAAAVILVNDDHDVSAKAKAERQRWSKGMQQLAELHAKFQQIDEPTPEQFDEHFAEAAKLNKQLHESAEKLQGNRFDEIVKFNAAGVGNRKSMPVFFVSREKIDAAFGPAMGESLADVERQIDEDLKPRSRALAGWNAVGEADVVRTQAEIKNVVAVLEGEGPLADETVIIGAHYDHLGMGGRGTLAPWTVEIHNGADDNASGTAALLEVARRLATRDEKPKRRVVFIAFSGEERGLLGSAHYVENPRFPLAETVAMINMDMVGRLKDNKLIVTGTGTAATFDELVERLNETHDFKLSKQPGGYGPSDHASFYPKKIPVIHVYTGTHKDYHRPSDDWDKINIEGMRRIVDFVTEFSDEVINAEARPEYVEVKRRGGAARTGSRPYLGTIPDFGAEADGLAVQDVAPGGPAEKAGMKAGDVIVKFGEHKIGNLDDIDRALRKFKAGDTVKVIVTRDGKETTLEVVLDPPK